MVKMAEGWIGELAVQLGCTVEVSQQSPKFCTVDTFSAGVVSA